MIVGLLGILKAGGAYVPLNPTYPKDRIAAIVEDSRAPVLLTQQAPAKALPPHQAQVIFLDSDREMIARESGENLPTEVGLGNLAYVLYTSGSTGKPKGVAIEHRSAATFVTWAKAAFTPEQLAGVLASTSLCFDLSVFELFGPLCW